MLPFQKLPQFSLLLPDIRSGFNVGAFFRTADGLGVEHIFLTGLTPYPPHKEIAKTALGAEQSVNWSYHLEALSLGQELRQSGIKLIALETVPNAEPVDLFQPQFPLCLILGNEVSGAPKDLLAVADNVLAIPMRGKKESFNVSIAGAIALWEISKKRYNIAS